MKIGALANAAGCQTVTIRFYEQQGLLDSVARSESNYRVYGERDLERLVFIRNCRTLGLTLKEITRLVAIQDDPTLDCDVVNACIDEHLADVSRQMQALRLLKAQLKRLRSRCMMPGASSDCGVLAALTNESLSLVGSSSHR